VGEALSRLLEIFGLSAVAALVSSLFFAWTARVVTPQRWSGYFIAACAVAVGFVAGYAMLPRDWAGWKPDAVQPWTWLPYGGLLAAIFASAFPPVPRSQAWKLVLIAVAPMAAVYLTPNWPVFGLGREKVRLLLVGYLLLVGVPLQYLPARLVDRGLLAVMTAAAVLTAVASGVMVSMKLGQLAAIGAGGLAGAWIAGLLRAKRGDLPAHSVIPVFAVLVGGVAWIACVEPDPAKASLLVIPLFPLVLWLVAPMSRFQRAA
jgi:hypothetical protein